MHHRELNRARFGLAFEPRGPVLIKSGLQTPDPTRPQLEFVRSRHAQLGDTVYLPGSSLKGVLRGQGERVLTGLGLQHVCRPVGRDAKSCRGDSREGSAAISRAQCPICRVFGSLAQAGRLQIGDAFPWPIDSGTDRREEMQKANRTERRFQVGIDRDTGGAQDSALFDLEVVVDGRFETIGQLRNFELWQLGLLAALVADLNAGFCAVGSGKSRGLGQMKAELMWLELELCEPKDRSFTTQDLLGIAGLLDAGERGSFGTVLDPTEDRLLLPEGYRWNKTWRGYRLPKRLEGEKLAELLNTLQERPLASFLRRGGLPPEVSHARR